MRELRMKEGEVDDQVITLQEMAELMMVREEVARRFCERENLQPLEGEETVFSRRAFVASWKERTGDEFFATPIETVQEAVRALAAHLNQGVERVGEWYLEALEEAGVAHLFNTDVIDEADPDDTYDIYILGWDPGELAEVYYDRGQEGWVYGWADGGSPLLKNEPYYEARKSEKSS